MKRLLAALFLVLFAAAVPFAEAQGAPLWLRRVSSAPPPPPPYDPLGVRFWPETAAQYVGVAGLNAGSGTPTDTGHAVIAYRQRGALGTITVHTPPDNWRVSNNFGTIGNNSCTSENSTGGMANQDAAGWSTPGDGYNLKSTWNQADAACPSGTARGIDVGRTNALFDNTWASFVQVYDAPSGKITVFKDGNFLCDQSSCATVNSAPTLVNWNSSRGFCFNGCNRGSGIPTGGVTDLSDVVVDTTNPLPNDCFTSPYTNCLTMVHAYVTAGGVPVALGNTTTDCGLFRASYSAPLQTDYCDRGDPSTFLLNNDGTAKPAVAVNLISGSNIPATLYPVNYSQGNTPTDRPYLAWAAWSQCGVTSSSTTCSLNPGSNISGNFGGNILTGDRIFAAFVNCALSTGQTSSNPPGSGTPAGNVPPSGWAFVTSSTTANPYSEAPGSGANARCQWAVYTHVATGDYVPTVNNDWATGNAIKDPPTFNYDTSGFAPKGVTVLMFDYRSANGTVNIVSANFLGINRAGCTGSCSANYVSAAITTSTTPETLVSLMGFRQSNAPAMVPAGTALEYSHFISSGNQPFWLMSDERIAGSLSSATRTFTQPTAGAVAPTASDRAYDGLIALADH